MACYHPIEAWKPAEGRLLFKRPQKVLPQLRLSCGRCIGCRLDRSRDWATRIMHETHEHEQNSFVTLTYDKKHLPENGSLVLKDFQIFCRSVRYERKRKKLPPFRYYHCGEYGEKKGRPHYHACVFGIDWREDRVYVKTNKEGDRLYESEELAKHWTKGSHKIGDLTWQSAAYVSRYITTKQTGENADEKYGSTWDYATGEFLGYIKQPEYATMSRRPGIGFKWINKFHGEVYPADEVIVRGHPSPPPAYYDAVMGDRNPKLMELIKIKRALKALRYKHDQTPERLATREKCKLADLSQYSREIE